MDKQENNKMYNLEERTLSFATAVRDLVKIVPKSLSNIEYGRQLIRSSGSVGANYIEANESTTKRDLRIRIGISRKEAKESKYWLTLLETSEREDELRSKLLNEALELTYGRTYT
jgi:four helix bundle protein